MFIGHWAPALVAAGVSKRAPKLGMLFIAAQLVDWGFFTLAIFGVEKLRVDSDLVGLVPLDLYFMPFTHSLLGTAIWSLVFAALLFRIYKDRRIAIIGGLVVFSHWLLDLPVHRPDLTIAGGDTFYGFGLWNYPIWAIALELGLILAAFFYFLRRTTGPIMPPWILLIFLLIIQAINWFGPQPEEASIALYLTALLSFGICAAIASWVGKSRRHIHDRGLASARSHR